MQRDCSVLRRHVTCRSSPGMHKIPRFVREALVPERLRGVGVHHAMEPPALGRLLERCGWHVEECVHFAAGRRGNPEGANLGGAEMFGATACATTWTMRAASSTYSIKRY